MNIRLSTKHRDWLTTQVAAGQFASVDEAIARAVDEMMALEADDFTWARPYLDKAEASLARGEGIAGDEFLDRLDHKLDSLR